MIVEIAERHDQRVDAEERDADPVDETDPEPDRERDQRSPSPTPCVPKRETVNAPAVAVVATERSTPPVSITSVWPAAISPSTAA